MNSGQIDDILIQLKTNCNTGLTSSEAASRRIQYGCNELDLNPPESLFYKFMEQFQNPLILLLLGSAGISVLIGHIADAVSIAITILLVLTGMSFFIPSYLPIKLSYILCIIHSCLCSRVQISTIARGLEQTRSTTLQSLAGRPHFRYPCQ